MFDFGLLQPFLNDKNITDIDSNSKTVYVKHNEKSKYKVLDLEEGYLRNLLRRLCNYSEINKEFNYNNPILDGTMDGFRIHAVDESVMGGYPWISIRRNPIELVAKREQNPKIFSLIELANTLKWSYVFGGERGGGKTQLMRSAIAMLPKNKSINIIAENDEMHMMEVMPDYLISQFIINDIAGYEDAVKSALRDNSDYVVFQEIRDSAIDYLFDILSASSRVFTTLHVKNALLMPQRMIQLSKQKNDSHLLSTIHDYVQMCIVPVAEEIDGKTVYYIKEVALFWNEEDVPKKKLIYECYGGEPILHDLPQYFQTQIKHHGLDFKWK